MKISKAQQEKRSCNRGRKSKDPGTGDKGLNHTSIGKAVDRSPWTVRTVLIDRPDKPKFFNVDLYRRKNLI